MALGRRARDEIERALACHSRFQNSTGSFYSTPGGTTKLGWLAGHDRKAELKALLAEATYTVWSYDTPIAFAVETDEGMTRYVIEESHSATTSQHMGVVRTAWGEYEDPIADYTREQKRSKRRARSGARASVPVNQAAVDRANAVTAGYAEAARREQDALIDEVRGYRHPGHP